MACFEIHRKREKSMWKPLFDRNIKKLKERDSLKAVEPLAAYFRFVPCGTFNICRPRVVKDKNIFSHPSSSRIYFFMSLFSELVIKKGQKVFFLFRRQIELPTAAACPFVVRRHIPSTLRNFPSKYPANKRILNP